MWISLKQSSIWKFYSKIGEDMDNIAIESKDYYMRAKMLFQVRKYKEAEKYFNKSIEVDSMNIDAYIDLSCMYIEMKQFIKAKEILKKVLVINNKNGEIYFHLGNIAYINKDIVSARDNYSKAISFGYENPIALYNMAMLKLSSKDIVNAKLYLNQILEKNPSHIKARLKLIEIANSDLKYEEVLAQSDELILQRPDAIEGYHHKFMALQNLNRDEDALRVISYALKLYPEDKSFAYDRVLLFIKQGLYQDALKYIDENFDFKDEASNVIIPQKAKILFMMNMFEEAKDLFEKVDENLFDEETRYILMLIYISTKEYIKALKISEKIIYTKKMSSPNFYYAALFFKGLCLKQLGRDENAKNAFYVANQKIKTQSVNEPENISLYMYRILCETFLENYNTAIELSNYAISLSEDDDLYIVRGIVYKMMKEEEKSKVDFDKAEQSESQLANILKKVVG